MNTPRRPIVIESDALPPLPDQNDTPDPFAPTGQAMQAVTSLAAGQRGGWFRRMVWGAAGGLAALLIGMFIYDSLLVMIAGYPVIAAIAIALTLIVVLGLLVVILREVAGIARLRRIDALRQKVETAVRENERAPALAAVKSLSAFYPKRADLAWAQQDLVARLPDLLDSPSLLQTAERLLMDPLDDQARLEIELAARQVAAATAMIPLPMIDVLAALAVNMRMLRRIAAIYGGRAGTLGSWRLMRAVAGHLLATGAVAMGDDLLGSVVGGGAIGKVSRRLGEGIVNGALTARVGIAAMDVCRPMPFVALKRPRVTSLVKRAMSGLFS